MRYLITGGCGFIGSNIAAEILKRGGELFIFDNLFRFGSSKNLDWLREQGEFKYYPVDIRNYNDVETVIKDVKPDVIFHLAGQVAMTTSIQNPRLDFEINTLGTHNLLEAVRKYSSSSIIVYSSTNKVYGDLEYLTYKETETRYICNEYPKGFSESLQLDFRSPYGCSKGAADQYLLDYYRMFGIRTVVFRHSSMYGGRQFATYDQGWVGWFCQKAYEAKNGLQKEPFTISGTGMQVRDLLHADDVKLLYLLAIDNIDKAQGNVFNIGGGIESSLSLIELFSMLDDIFDVKLNYTKIPVRKSDQKVFVADITKAQKLLNWNPTLSSHEGIIKMCNWVNKQNV